MKLPFAWVPRNSYLGIPTTHLPKAGVIYHFQLSIDPVLLVCDAPRGNMVHDFQSCRCVFLALILISSKNGLVLPLTRPIKSNSNRLGQMEEMYQFFPNFPPRDCKSLEMRTKKILISSQPTGILPSNMF